MSEPPGNSSTATLTNSQMSNLYYCDQCGCAVRINSRRIRCPRCNNFRHLTQLRNPDFHYSWNNVDGIQPPRLPPQPVPARRYNYNINDSRSGGSAIMSLLFRPRPQRRLFQSLTSNQEIDSAAPPIPSTVLEVERMEESSSMMVPSITNDPTAVTRHPYFLRRPGLNPSCFVIGPERNITASVLIQIVSERARPLQAWPPRNHHRQQQRPR